MIGRMLAMLCVSCCTFAVAGEPKPGEAAPGFSVRFLDEAGKPVSGVSVGYTTGFGNTSFSGQAWYNSDPDNDTAYSATGNISDSNGVARFPNGREWLSAYGGIVARHSARGLASVARLDADSPHEQFDVTLRPACRVHGQLSCLGLAEVGKSLDHVNADVMLNHQLLSEHWSRDSKFEFYLPPGEYELVVRSGGLANRVRRPFTVSPRQKELNFEVVDMPPSPLALLIGKPAPPLADVVAWKNCSPLDLTRLRGKVVLLEFWGYWCGPCIGRMPALFELHDQFAKQGLTIVGVHVDADDEIDSVAKLDEKLLPIRKELWAGRDIPFPVAMVLNKRVLTSPGSTDTVRSQIAADYGIMSYPTQVLIDKQGKFVGTFHHTPEGMKRLQQLLDAD